MAAGALIGPWALRVVNPDYHVGRATVALLVLAAGLVCLLTLTGAGALALDRHRLYVLGWVVASLVARRGAFDAVRPDAAGGRLPAGRPRGRHGGAPGRPSRHVAGAARRAPVE